MQRLGIDIGGTGIKAAVVDVTTGALLTERERILTPAGFELDDIVDTVAHLVDRFGHDDAVGVGFPGVVAHGVVMSPPTAHEYPGWVGCDLGAAIHDATGLATTVLNDADAAGIAEYRFGAGDSQQGMVMVFTLGTGVGSAMIVDGALVPNTELGKLYLADRSDVAELQIADRVRTDEDLKWREWGERLNTYFQHIDRLFTPDLVIVGGGVSKKHERFLHHIDIRAEVVPAELRNQAGVVGAAIATVEVS